MSPRSSKPVKKGKAKPEKKRSGDKPSLDVYTGLLFAAFLAITIGCILLTVELGKYDWTMG